MAFDSMAPFDPSDLVRSASASARVDQSHVTRENSHEYQPAALLHNVLFLFFGLLS
jgi:hypothetical protein